MIARTALWLGVGGCFVGYPPAGGFGDDDDDDGLLPDPPCDAASIEPDDGETVEHVSQIGAALETPRTFCGRVDEASTDGRTYTGDLDLALLHTLEAGTVRLVLSWDEGRTDLDVLLALDATGEDLALGADGVIEERLPAGVYTVLIAGTDGPATDYQLDVWLE